MEKTPFSVLNLPRDAGLDAARSRYRQLARVSHPDTAKGDKAAATRVMSELNWAMDELERHADQWRADIGVPQPPQPEAATARPISVAPELVLLRAEDGYHAYVTAAAPDVDASTIRLRYASDVIHVERLPDFGGVANFRISLAEGLTMLAAPVRERVEIRARGCEPYELSVAVEAFEAEAGVEPPEEAPSQHDWLHLAGWASAVAGATAIVLFIA